MKNKGCNLILRFSVVTEKMNERAFHELISKFPNTYDKISSHKEEKSITYVKTFKNIFDIEVCNNDFNYPSLYFYPNFNSFISDLDIIFSMYFYND